MRIAIPLALAAGSVATAGQRPVSIALPGGTAIPVHVVGSVSSANVKQGDTFAIQAAQPVIANGMVVIPSGAEGQGRIVEVDHAGGNGHSGSLQLNFDWIYSADGGKVALSNTTQKQAEEDRKGAMSTATIIGVATLGLGGLFGHNLAHGREVTIDDHKILNAFVARTVHVKATQQAQAADQYDR